EQRIKNSKGLVAYTAPDQQTYGRSVGVLADEYSNINLQLLQYGQATALPYGSKEQDVLSRSMATKQEAFARENTLGLWNYKRYQVQHELLGSSLTHNQLMRADRDDSYVGYRKAQLGALGNQQLDSRFSARDDNYNTIEGLGHQGIAHYLRRVMTPFG
ncbi:thermonuclease family protein, partial [Mangrovimonas sp. AS39]|uniref:thermonuclease family protein n=1 Tax=Mangrovimonas futianensis TaxID=2895523 RepID=UPI001E319BEE